MKPVIIHGDARSELDEAMSYYEGCADGLGLDPQTRIEEMIAKIRENPEAWPPHGRGGFRKCFAEQFPFTVFYLELPDHIWVVAIAHGSRCPGYRTKRRSEGS